MQSSPTEIFLSNDLKSLLDSPLFSNIKLKGNDGKEISAHRNILVVRLEVFKRMLLNGMKETTQSVIEFPEFSSTILHVILEYLYTGRVTLKFEIVAEVYHGADFFLLEQLKLQIIELFKTHLENNVGNKTNISAKVLSQLLECMESTNNEFANLLCNTINSVSLKSIDYCNLNAKALEYILSNIKRNQDFHLFSLSRYDLFHYITLWAASGISDEALSFYTSCLPSSEMIKGLTYEQELNLNVPFNIPDTHAKYQSTMITKISPLLNYVDVERIHPFIISNIIEPFGGLINSKTLMDVYRKQALFFGKYADFDCFDNSFQWDDGAHGSNMCLNRSVVVSNSSSHEWIRTIIPISGKGLFEWDIVVEKVCDCFWVGICTENGFDVNYNTWLGKQAYGWVLGSIGVICHDTQQENGPYTSKYGQEFEENDRITVHLNMGERTCSFSINGKKYPVAFRNLPDVVYPTVSLRAPGKARIEPHK